MPGTIELHAFMGLTDLFRKRQWSNPTAFALDGETPGYVLLDMLGIGRDQVEVIFLNRKAVALGDALIHPGDRVALVPPGVPGPHRLLLGLQKG